MSAGDWRLTDWRGSKTKKWLAKTLQVKQKAAVEMLRAGKVDEAGQTITLGIARDGIETRGCRC